MIALVLASQLFLAADASASQSSNGIYSLPQDAFAAQARRDLTLLHTYANGLRRLQEQLKAHPELFHRKANATYSPDEKRTLLTIWGAFYSYEMATETIRQRYWDFVKVPQASQLMHAFGYLDTHLALTTELAHGLTFADQTAGDPQLEVLLDEANAEYGIPPKAYADFKVKVIHIATTTQLITGDAYLSTQQAALKRTKLGDDKEVQWALTEMGLNSKAAKQRLLKRGPNMFVKNAGDIMKDGAMSAIFPVQKEFATWFGDTRVARIGKPLIKKEQVLEVLKKMEPGDVMVARQNWFLSNIALPGFWPHAELYGGTAADMAAYFDSDPEVTRYVATLPEKADRFTAYLQTKYPEKWKAYATGTDLLGNGPIRVIESISEGVSFTGIEHAMMVDYLGVMRPKVSKLEKAKAIIRAFGYQGRPYDFDFDFFSDSTLVCTELVYKSYLPASDMKGLKMPLVEVAGRQTLPANEIVKLFDEQYDKPERQLDFVAFLEGSEKDAAAFARDVDSFRKSHARVKWDVAQR
jgi:hypothetical protein